MLEMQGKHHPRQSVKGSSTHQRHAITSGTWKSGSWEASSCKTGCGFHSKHGSQRWWCGKV
jgi:hypothetical protein